MQNVIEFEASKAGRFNWNTIVWVSVFHIMGIVALFNFSWPNAIAALVTWWIASSWGIGIGYHRLFTHRGFKAPMWLQYFLATCGSLALQSGPISWVTTHRIHHAFTETDKDPHSPMNGTYWSHIGWIFRGTAQGHSQATLQRYSPDLTKDRYLTLLNNYYYVTLIACAFVLLAIGGWTMVLWGVFLRTAVSWHFTWLVNSATHLWGSRRFDTRDDSRNNALVAALTFGEGWHNNHHAFPTSAHHGLTRWQLDPGGWLIDALERLGLAWDIVRISGRAQREKLTSVPG